MNRMISFGYGFVDGKLSVIAEEAEIVKGILPIGICTPLFETTISVSFIFFGFSCVFAGVIKKFNETLNLKKVRNENVNAKTFHF